MAKVGVVGLGFMGRMHIAAHQKVDGAELVALCDQDERRAAGDFSGGWGNIDGAAEQLDMTGITGTTDFDELLAVDGLDVVDLCIPTPFHEELAVKALEAGKHVLCEKPLALDSATAQRIADAAERASGLFMPAMCMRFWPEWQWLKRAVDAGTYGAVRGATFRRLAPIPPGWYAEGDMSGGALLDLHIHDTDFVYHLLGRPDEVFSRGYTIASGRTDHIVTQYVYKDGPALVAAEGGWVAGDEYPFTMRCTVDFERATADFDIGRETPLLLAPRGGSAEPVDLSDQGDGYYQEIAYFIDCVNRGAQPETVTARDAVAGLRLAEAEQRSIETGQPVRP